MLVNRTKPWNQWLKQWLFLGSDSVSLFKVMSYHLIRMRCVPLLTYGSLLMLSLFASICYLEQKESILGGLLTAPVSKLHVSRAENILTATVNMNSPVRTTTGTKEEQGPDVTWVKECLEKKMSYVAGSRFTCHQAVSNSPSRLWKFRQSHLTAQHTSSSLDLRWCHRYHTRP